MQVFLTSPWVPPEWIKAHGLEPRGIWDAKNFSFEALSLSAGVCAFAEAAVRFRETQSESAIVFTTHCDQLRRGFDAIGAAAKCRAFLFNLPATWQTGVSRSLYASELQRLGGFLVGLGGHAPSTLEFASLFEQYSLARTRLVEAAPFAPARRFAAAIAQFHWSGPASSASDGGPWTSDCGLDNGLPVALIGGPLPQAHWGLLDIIERCGGRVVLNATEAGERSLLWGPQDRLGTPHPGPLPFRRGEGEASAGFGVVHAVDSSVIGVQGSRSTRATPLETLAETFIGGCVDVFQRPNTRLYSWLRERLAARNVRGILLWHYVGCDLWRAEAQSLREAFGLPLLQLDADESPADSPRNVGRIQAFLEGLRA